MAPTFPIGGCPIRVHCSLLLAAAALSLGVADSAAQSLDTSDIRRWREDLAVLRRVMIEPAIAAPLSFADYVAGRDPALEAVFRAGRAQ